MSKDLHLSNIFIIQSLPAASIFQARPLESRRKGEYEASEVVGWEYKAAVGPKVVGWESWDWRYGGLLRERNSGHVREFVAIFVRENGSLIVGCLWSYVTMFQPA